jgi:hypothetical protein
LGLDVTGKSFENPNWAPLEKMAGPRVCAQFMWMWRENGVEFYKHILTRRYLLLDSSGQCYRQSESGLEQAEFQEELLRVSA